MFDQMNGFDVKTFQEYNRNHRPQILTYEGGREAAVGVPLIYRDDKWSILLEVRSADLNLEPSAVCFPGGSTEDHESPLEACRRELCEELLISDAQIHVVGETDGTIGPNGAPIWAYVLELTEYDCTYSKDEVAAVFLLPLDWLMEHPPKLYAMTMRQIPGDDFPYDLLPGGRAYKFRERRQGMPFYVYQGHVIWGATARILMHFAARVEAALAEGVSVEAALAEGVSVEAALAEDARAETTGVEVV